MTEKKFFLLKGGSIVGRFGLTLDVDGKTYHVWHQKLPLEPRTLLDSLAGEQPALIFRQALNHFNAQGLAAQLMTEMLLPLEVMSSVWLLFKKQCLSAQFRAKIEEAVKAARISGVSKLEAEIQVFGEMFPTKEVISNFDLWCQWLADWTPNKK